MTISSATRKAGPYLGDATTTSFPFTFKVFKKADVRVTFTNVNGADSALTLDSDYSVLLNDDQNNNPGGTVTYPRVGSSLANLQIGEKLTLTGGLEYTQPTDLPNLSPYFPEVVEDALDRAEIQIQQVKEITDRAITISVSDSPLTPLPPAAGRGNTVIGFDALGNVVVLPLPASIGAGDMRVDTFSSEVDFTPGVTTQLTLSRAPGSPANLEVFFDALYQGPDQWSLNGAQITFSTPIPGGVQKVFARTGTVLSLNIPAAGSVGDDQLAWGESLTRVAATLAALKALDTSKYKNARTLGRNAIGDGAGGEWRFEPASIAAPNDITVAQPNSGAGRWLRIFDGFSVKACWAGAGMGAADDTAAITAALAVTPTGGTLDFESRHYNLIPSTNVAYKDKFNVTRKTAVQIVGRSNIALLFRAGSMITVNGTDAERVAFFLKSCTNVTISGAYFPNLTSTNSIGGSDYLPSENYNPFALEGNNGIGINGLRTEASRNGLMMDAYNGAQNQNIFVDGLSTYQTCNYSVITRNADNVQVLNGRFEQTGRSWNTSNEDVAFSDNSANCKAVNCDAIDPVGRVARFAAGRNVGPTVFDNCRLKGDGIWVEIYEASNVQVIGGYSKRTAERVSSHILFTADIFQNNANVSVIGAHFFGGGLIVSDYYPSGWSAADIDGFVMQGCTAQDTYGMQMALTRVGCVIKGNRFSLNSGGTLLQTGGKGTVFEGNSVNNGYVRVDGDEFIATGNHMHGNLATPLSFAWDVQGARGFYERGNTYSPGGFANYWNHAPSAAFGARYLEVGHDQNPQFALSSVIVGRVGDFIQHSLPLDGTPEGWVCTVAGAPGTWRTVGQNGYRGFSGAPSTNANFIGEESLDTVNGKWYKAKNTGTGATDWVALN